MYPSLSVGLAADVATITGGTAYSGVIAALDAGDVDAAGTALQVSPWCTTPDGGQCPGYGASIVSLVVEYSADAASWQSASSVLVGTTALVGGPGAGGAALPAASGDLAPLWAFLTAQLGKPYQWGGAGPDSWDCSGLVMVPTPKWVSPWSTTPPPSGPRPMPPKCRGRVPRPRAGRPVVLGHRPVGPVDDRARGDLRRRRRGGRRPHTGTVVQVQAWWPSGYFGRPGPWPWSNSQRARSSGHRLVGTG